jgi:hypothetical protein
MIRMGMERYRKKFEDKKLLTSIPARPRWCNCSRFERTLFRKEQGPHCRATCGVARANKLEIQDLLGQFWYESTILREVSVFLTAAHNHSDAIHIFIIRRVPQPQNMASYFWRIGLETLGCKGVRNIGRSETLSVLMCCTTRYGGHRYNYLNLTNLTNAAT